MCRLDTQERREKIQMCCTRCSISCWYEICKPEANNCSDDAVTSARASLMLDSVPMNSPKKLLDNFFDKPLQ